MGGARGPTDKVPLSRQIESNHADNCIEDVATSAGTAFSESEGLSPHINSDVAIALTSTVSYHGHNLALPT